MKCHYEVLQIQRDASDDDIRKSYRKLALRCHPDKNPDRIDECTKEFHLLQQAYEVLSDPQERAWFDKHRSVILRGGQGQTEDYTDNSVDIYPFFNSSCYNGFNDNDDGFYSIYRKLFESIANQDLEFMEDNDSDDDFIIPSFGDSKCYYEETVGTFYSYWDGYCTLKSYDWCDQHDLRQAPSRYIRRAMESDNKKIREKAKKERNEEIRALVAFVKKRDRRMHAHKLKLKERAAEITRLTKENTEKHRKERLEQLADYEEASWSSVAQVEKELKELEIKVTKQFDDTCENDSNSEDSETYDDYMCVACNKVFKSEKSFSNHEKSKRHKENVLILKAEMHDEELLTNTVHLSSKNLDDSKENDDELDIENEDLLDIENEDLIDIENEDLIDIENELISDDSIVTEKVKKCKKKKKRDKQNQKRERLLKMAETSTKKEDIKLSNIEETRRHKENELILKAEMHDDELLTNPVPLYSKNLDDLKENDEILDIENEDLIDIENELISDDSIVTEKVKKCKKKKIKRDKQNYKRETLLELAEQSTKKEDIKKEEKKVVEIPIFEKEGDKEETEEAVNDRVSDENSVNNQTEVTSKENTGWKAKNQKYFCRMCTRSFKSHNKLFEHVKSTGHAIHIDELSAAAQSIPEFGNKRRKQKKRGKKHVEYDSDE